MWGHIWNVSQSFGLFAHGESSCVCMCVCVRNHQAESFHFLMSDRSAPNLRKCQRLPKCETFGWTLLLLFCRLAVMEVTP